MKCGPEAKKSTAWAMSPTSPLRPMGVFAAKRAAARSSAERAEAADRAAGDVGDSGEAGNSGEEGNSIQPGATQLTLTSGANALAMALVSMCKAAFEAQ